MIGNPRVFTTLFVFPKPKKIILADSHNSPALGKESVEITPHFLKYVYVPSFPTTLLSVCKLSTSLDWSILFTKALFNKAKCEFQDATTRKVIGCGCSRRGLHFLEISRPKAATVLCNSKFCNKVAWPVGAS